MLLSELINSGVEAVLSLSDPPEQGYLSLINCLGEGIHFSSDVASLY